jgi:hypothetical protein
MVPQKRALILIAVVVFSVLPLCIGVVAHEADRYPGEHWEKARSPEALGYSSEKLEKAEAFTQTLNTAAVMIVVAGCKD